MKSYSKNEKSTSHTFDEEPRASHQAPMHEILETYQRKANRTGLPDDLKTGIENQSGYSMDDVNVHYNSNKPAQLNALAYTQGTDICVAPGQEKHLPHEAWHVVQQKQGRVQPTLQMQGVSINDNEGLEKEADVMGYAIIQKKDEDDIQAEEEVNNMLNVTSESDALGILASTIDDKNLSAPFNTSLSFNIKDAEAIKNLTEGNNVDGTRLPIKNRNQGYIGPLKNEKLKKINDIHTSMNWSLLTKDSEPKLFDFKDRVESQKKRNFAYITNPSAMLDRIISVSAQDESSNSNLTEKQVLDSFEEPTGKKNELKKIANKSNASSNQNSEIKTLSFPKEGFMGLLCNTDAYKETSMYKDFLKLDNPPSFIRIFKYIFNESKTELKCIAKVSINKETEQITIDDFNEST